MERIHNSLYVLHHLIGGIGQSSWELSYPVYRFDCGDLTGDSCPEIAVGVIKTTRHDPTRDKRLFLFKLYQGRQGLADTYQALRASGITPLGYGHSTEEQLSPAIIRKKGVKAPCSSRLKTGSMRKASRMYAVLPSTGLQAASGNTRRSILRRSSSPSCTGARNSSPIPTYSNVTTPTN